MLDTSFLITSDPKGDWRAAKTKAQMGYAKNGEPAFVLQVRPDGKARVCVNATAMREFGASPSDLSKAFSDFQRGNDRMIKRDEGGVRLQNTFFRDEKGFEMMFESFEQGIFGGRTGFEGNGVALFAREETAKAAFDFLRKNAKAAASEETAPSLLKRLGENEFFEDRSPVAALERRRETCQATPGKALKAF